MSTYTSATVSKHTHMNVPQFRARKSGKPLVCLTAYTAPMAKILAEQCDMLLVGDSVGTVLHGFSTTICVTLEHMIIHGQAVVRGAPHAFVVVDMPFGSYEESPAVALRNAVRLMKETGCAAVKVEGSDTLAETVAYLTARGIPVMGHVGLLPQNYHISGGYKSIRTVEDGNRIINDAQSLADAGAFGIVVEGVAEPIAARMTKEVDVPIIGIGASAECDGQILVTEDLLGLFPKVPKFVKKMANMELLIQDAVKSYAQQVRSRTFPSSEQTYTLKHTEQT